MKKFTLFLFAITMSLLSFAAQPKRIYAYDLSSALVDKVYTFSFTANETPTSGKIIFYDATSSELVGEIALTNPVLGKNEVEIAEYSLPGNDGQQLNWSVELSAAAVTAYEKIFADASHRYRRGYSNVDVSPESDHFGHVYVADRTSTKSLSKFYVYNPVYAISDANGHTLGANTWAFGRFTIAPDGTVWLTDYSDGHSGLFLVDPDNLATATQFFAGTRASSGLFKNGSVEVGSSLSCASLYGKGADTKLVTVAEDYTGTSFPVAVFNVGQSDGTLATTWTTAPNILFNTLGNAAQIFDIKACEQGVWVATNRGTGSNSSGATSLRFYTWEGNCTWSSHEHTDLINGSLGGSLAITPDEKQIIMKIQDNTIAIFDVTWSGNTPTLTLNASFNCGYAAVSAINLDYAGNIVTIAGTAFSGTDTKRMSLVVYSNPTTNNTCEVPAKKADVVTKVEAAVTLYTITTNVNDPIMGSVSGNLGTYEDGASAELTAVANEHYEFTGWTGDVNSTENPLTINVDGNKTITANFAKKQYTLTVFVNDENKGTIDVATGSHEYGTEVTLTATPKPGYKLLYWNDRSTENPRTITMSKNEALSAYFVKEYSEELTFTIEKIWENAQVPAATADGYQAVGWDEKIYMQNKTAGKIQVFSNGTDAPIDYATSGTGQQIAIDEAGNLIVFNAYFATATPNAVLIYKKGSAEGTAVSFNLQAPARCDFFSASGDIFSPEGGYVYFYCAGKTVINRLKITNGAAVAADVTTDVVGESVYSSPQNTNHVMVDIFGNLVVHARSNAINAINIYTNESKAFTLPSIKMGTLGGCSFELGGKELWAYHAGASNYSSEWNIYNMTDSKFLSDDDFYAVDKEATTNYACNWLNVQVVDEKTAYIYQFCPKKAAAVWKVTAKETFTVGAEANNVEWGTVSGADKYLEGTTATLTATPNTGYKFVNWTKGGTVVSTNATYEFPVEENVELVANFEVLAKTPRAWAYDLKLGEEGENYTFTFNATTAGQATIIFKDKDGNALAQPASQTITAVAGENKFTIAKNEFVSGTDAFWSITMDGDPIEGIAEVTDQSRGIYDFYSMMGVIVDNNTDSKDFGKIYIQQSYQRSYATSEAKNDGITSRANTQTSGIFVYNQELNELNDPSNVGYKPTIPSGYTEIGSSSSAFQRLNIHPKTGNLVYSHAIAGKPAVFAINRDDMTSTVTNLLTGVADMTRSVAHCFDADGTLFVMDFAENQGAVYKVINGDATRITEISPKFINAHITMASDGRGGLWISQNRGQMDGAPYYYQLVHVNNVGEYDWAVNKETPHDFVGSSSRGALAYDADRQILAQGRNGKVELYTVSYEPTITLTPLYTIANDDLGNNIDGLAFDYAGDLYVVNSSKEKFQKFSLPTTDNICTVAAPSSEAIRFTPVYTVSVESNNNEWGIVSGGGTFEEGQSATITATAATNYKFVNWTKGSTEVSTENPYTFSVTETATYTANFVEKTKYTIDVTYDNTMGTVSGAGSYYEGIEVTLTAKANGGYVFVKWSDEVTDESRTFNASENVTLQAIFKVATPRAWAYDLNMVEDGDDYKFTFTPTSAGNATILFTDKDGTPVSPTQEVVGAVGAGEPKTVSIAKSQFIGAQDIYWSVKVEGEAITKMAEITDPTKGIYDIVTPQGIAIDNNTESDYFGQIYVAAATDGTVGRGAQTRGIFVYNPILNELNSPNVGNLPANVTLTDNTRQAIHRVAVNPTNSQVAFAYNISGSTAVWSMNPENLAGDAVNLIDGAGITKANSICFDENGILYVMDNANTGATGGQIYKVEDGVATLFAAHQAGYQWATEENSIVSDGRGGLWIAQNRWSVDAYPALSHVNKDGIVDFAVTTSSPEALKALFPHDDNNASYRGQCAYHVADDILAFAGNKEAVLFKITYDANNVPTNLEKLMSTGKLGTNIDGVAFDYSGDLYVASESTHRFYKFVVPTNDNTCTVPAPMSQFIQKEARYTVTVVANEAAMGTVSAGGEYKAGEIITLTATANADYRFVNWTKGADVISTDASFSYTVPAENVTIVANFELKPLEMVGTVKRAVQIDDATIVLTHESNGTAHIYNVVNGEVKNELSQSSVVPVDTENAGDYLAISDIAATDDGKLVAINKIVCQASDDQVDAGYKRGETKVYLWNDLAADPTLWFTSKMSSNWFRSVQGHTMAYKGTSTNGTLFTTGVTAAGVKFRYSVYNVIDGVYTEPAVNDSEHYHFTKGDAQTTDILGANYEINASPLASENWILDGGNVDPFEITDPLTFNSQVTAGTTITEDLGKKYNGATYLTIQGVNLMVAPYADGEKVGGVTVLNISGGLNKATELAYQALGSSITATAAATAVKVNGNELLVTLVTDNKVQTLPITVELPIHTREVPAGYYATVCLPYNLVKVTGAILYEVAGKDNGKVYLDEVLVSETEAGKPYIYLAEADAQVFYYGDDETTIAGDNKSLHGTFVKLEDADLVGMYMLQSNKVVKCAATGCWIDPYRAYFDGYELETLGKPGAQMPGRRRVSLGATEENTTTGSEDIVTPNEQVIKVIENGQVIIIRDGVKYNAQGIKL